LYNFVDKADIRRVKDSETSLKILPFYQIGEFEVRVKDTCSKEERLLSLKEFQKLSLYDYNNEHFLRITVYMQDFMTNAIGNIMERFIAKFYFQ
jgi:hypothetical protein